MLNSRNNAFYGVFMPLHHSLGFPNMILEGGSFDPDDPPCNKLSVVKNTLIDHSVTRNYTVAPMYAQT